MVSLKNNFQQMKKYNAYLAELIGTFALSFIVFLAVSSQNLPLAVPVMAGLTLGLFVYIIGTISGCHINPAVTIGLWSVKKIKWQNAIGYIISQFVGASLSIVLGSLLFHISEPQPNLGAFSLAIFCAEALGTLFFTFGIASVVYEKVPHGFSGIIIGSSLLFGILIASMSGSFGILNPAVAFSLHAMNWTYLLAPLIGSVAGFNVYKWII
jgi:glycerol uptake facilitator-like aquaporin